MGEEDRPTVSGEKGKGRKFCRASIDSLDDVLFFFLFLEIRFSLRFASREGEREGEGTCELRWQRSVGGREGREEGRNLVRGETVRSPPPRRPSVVMPTWPNSAVRPSMFHPSDNESEFKCQSALLGKRFLSVAAAVIACRQLVCRHHEEFVARYPSRHRLRAPCYSPSQSLSHDPGFKRQFCCTRCRR